MSPVPPIAAPMVTAPPSSSLRWVWAYVRRYRLRLMAMGLALLCTSLSVLSVGKGIGYVIDKGFVAGNAQLLDTGLLLLVTIIVVLGLATFARSYLIFDIAERVIADIRRDVFAHAITLPPSFYDTHMRSGDVVSRVTTDTALLSATIASVLSVSLRNIILLVGSIIMLWLTNWKLTCMVLLLLPCVVVPIILLGKRVRHLARGAQESISAMGAYAQEVIEAIRIVQAFDRGAYEAQQSKHYIAQALRSASVRITYRSLLVACVIVLIFSAIALVLWVGGHDVMQGRLSAGNLSAFIVYAVLMAGSTGSLSEVFSDLQRAMGAIERLQELASIHSAITSPLTPMRLPSPVQGEVRYAQLSFAYPSRPDSPILRGISCHIRPGQMVAIVGPSGAGKTTLFHLLLRFYDPCAGSIMLDGIPIAQLSLGELRRAMAWVPQEPVIFSASVRDNITYGMPEATEEALIQATKDAEAYDFIMALPQQFATYVGEKGIQLSGGQRQRIAIARALLRNPAILLLDEATSHLDADNERRVHRALDRVMQGRTTLVIAHRLSTIEKADHILVMEQGQIVAEGTHARLLATCPLYQTLSLSSFQPQ